MIILSSALPKKKNEKFDLLLSIKIYLLIRIIYFLVRGIPWYIYDYMCLLELVDQRLFESVIEWKVKS